jgi:hypothetical protein
VWVGDVPWGCDGAAEWVWFVPSVAAGLVPVGGVWEAFERLGGLFPVYAAFAMYRVDAVMSVGGWPGTPSDADASLLMVVSDRFQGWVCAEPVFMYRQHELQNTRNEWWVGARDVTRMLMRSRHEGERG